MEKKFLILLKKDEKWELQLPSSPVENNEVLFSENEAAKFMLLHEGEKLLVFIAEKYSGEPVVKLQEFKMFTPK